MRSVESRLGLVIYSRDPYCVVEALLDHLESFGRPGQIKASWIRDVYSEVIRGLREMNLTDPEWIPDLKATLCKQLNSIRTDEELSNGVYFGERGPGEWGWWRE